MEFNYGVLELCNAEIIDYENISKVTLPSFKEKINIGKISNLSQLFSFKSLEIMQRLNNSNNIPIAGSFEELLEHWILAGRNSGQLNVQNYGDNDNRTFNSRNVGWTLFKVNFSDTGCSITPGTNFVESTLCSGATYNKSTGQWTYLPIEDGV